MRILLVTTEILDVENPGGGLASFTDRFSHALIEQGHQVKVLSYGSKRIKTNRDGLAIESVKVRGPKWMTLLDILSLRILAPTRTIFFKARSISDRMRQLVKNDHFDIVQYPNLEALSLFHRGEVPAVIRCSSDTKLWRVHGGYDLEDGWAIKQRHLLEVRAARRCNAIYAPSELVANVVSQRIQRSVEVLRPPVFAPSVQVDPTVIRRTVGNAPFLLFVGTLNRLKGLPTLSKIISPVLNRHPTVHCVLAGQDGEPDSPNPLKNEFLMAAGKNHHRIHFTGALSHTSLIPFYQEALAIVLPSLVDNLPNTMLEGMVHGGIVIGTKGASFDEIITDRVNGLLCERANPESLLQAIDEALSLDDPRRALMVRAAKKRIDMFRPEVVIPQTVTYFENVIHSAGKRRSSTPPGDSVRKGTPSGGR